MATREQTGDSELYRLVLAYNDFTNLFRESLDVIGHSGMICGNNVFRKQGYAKTDGLAQRTSAPISARLFASWLISEEFHHATKPLASVALLLSEAVPAPFVDPKNPATKFDVTLANSANVRRAVTEFFKRGDEN